MIMIPTTAGLVAIKNIKAGNKVISTHFETFGIAEKIVLKTLWQRNNRAYTFNN